MIVLFSKEHSISIAVPYNIVNIAYYILTHKILFWIKSTKNYSCKVFLCVNINNPLFKIEIPKGST